jgi:hypothetical protein
MITSAAEAVCAEAGYAGGLEIILTIPEGKALAEKTFNPMLGIVGGISVLGTSGIVEPMSTQALLDTIALEARQISALHGLERLIMVPGNYGMDFLAARFPQLSAVPRLKCSNYIGDALDIAALEGFREVLLIGHVNRASSHSVRHIAFRFISLPPKNWPPSQAVLQALILFWRRSAWTTSVNAAPFSLHKVLFLRRSSHAPA